MKRRNTISILLCALGAMSVSAQENVAFSGTYYVDGNVENDYVYRSHVAIEAVKAGQSVAVGDNGAKLVLTAIRLTKTGGMVADDNERTLYGVNSAVVSAHASDLLLEECDITCHIDGANGVAATGEGSKLKMQEGTVTVSREKSAGISAMSGGLAEAEGTQVTCYSNQSPAVMAGVGGTVKVTGLKGTTGGIGSPLFASQGRIDASDCKMETNGSQLVSIIGGGYAGLEKCTLTSQQYCGMMLFNNTDEKAPETGNLTIRNSKITVKDGPLFYVTNTDAEIHLTGTSFQAGDILLTAKADDWGIKGQNGGHVLLQADKQSMRGEIVIDSISSVTVQIDDADFYGSINTAANTCAEGRVIMNKGATWTVMKDSYIKSIEFEEPFEKVLKKISGSGNVYYDAADARNAYLGGKEYKLGDKGMLRPWN